MATQKMCISFFFSLSNSHWGCSRQRSHSSRVWAAPKQLHKAGHGSLSFLPVPSGLWEPTRMGQLQAAHKGWEISPNSFIPPPIPKGNGAVGTAGSILMQHILQCFSVWCAFSRALWICVQHNPVQGSAVLGDVGTLSLSPWAPSRVALSSGVNGVLLGGWVPVCYTVSNAGAGGGCGDGGDAVTSLTALSGFPLPPAPSQ